MNLSQLKSLVYINLVRLRRRTELYQPTFNPKRFPIINLNEKKRASDQRLRLIVKYIDLKKINSYLDVGSNFGYFVFSLAQAHNLAARGIEKDTIAFRYSRAIANLNKIKNVSFKNLKITPLAASKLPEYDLISCLNVFHHLVFYQGLAKAKKVISTLAKKSKYFVFETGTFAEKDFPWTQSLKFMGADSEKWVRSYLKSLGLKIIHQAEFKTHLGTKRSLFICRY